MGARRLVDGVYQEVVTQEIERAIEDLLETRTCEVAELDKSDSHVAIARALWAEIEGALEDVKGDDKPTKQLAIANELLEVLRRHKVSEASRALVEPARELLAVHAGASPTRPRLPLGVSTLLTLGRDEPRIGHELAAELATADHVDALVSFVTRGGVRVLRHALDQLCRRHRPGSPPLLRLITTTYTGATEAGAVEELARLPGVAVKVSYDGRRTRLHAKAWVFHRETGHSTAYVGSANLSNPALTSGLEWMVKLASGDLPHVVRKIAGAFDTLWQDREFEPFDPESESARERLRGALSAASPDADNSTRLTFFALEPYDYQDAILEKLRAEREIHGRFRNLVVAATGTGKTLIAAFDYTRRATTLKPRLLFIAHRRELLIQARDSYRQVLSDGAFGELFTGDDPPPKSHDHLFATIQSLKQSGLVTKLGADFWNHVVVDECHHAPADSYQAIIPALRPEVLVGLTATPERQDQQSLLGDFCGQVAAELRLWHALEKQLLAPFEYYGIHDGITEKALEAVRWSRTSGYEIGGLDKLYTGNDARADLIVKQLRDRVVDTATMRALGFCVSVEHAHYMAAHFQKRGISAIAIDGRPESKKLREAAPKQLENRETNIVFTCDLYNEGVDLPFVDTLLLLRPTQSATLFLQQLGRGLRLSKGKASCLVLDFIGQHRQEFRFDGILSGMTGLPRARLADAAEDGFPFLPSGCSMVLDQVARETIVRSLRASIEPTWRRMVADAAVAASQDSNLDLPRFLELSGRTVEDVYRTGSWTKLRQDAALDTTPVSTEELALCRRLRHLTHIDDRDRLVRIQGLVEGTQEPEPREALMLAYQMEHEPNRFYAAEGVGPWLRSQVAPREELRQLARVLIESVSIPRAARPVQEWPLLLHHHYERREILTATGYWTSLRKVPQQQGVLRFEEEKRELLFVTIDKTDGTFSATTRYKDFAKSRELFNWETQNSVSADGDTALHYIQHVSNGWSIYLFVQPRKGDPFAFLGPVTYQGHTGSRPVSIEWRLETPMPAILFQEYGSLASG